MSVRFARERLLDVALPSRVRSARARALQIAEAGLAAVDAEQATRSHLLQRPLAGAFTVFAFGKASVSMTTAALSCVDVTGGVVVALHPAPELVRAGLEVRLGGHPTPADDALETGQRVARRATSLGEGEQALCLVSGGGSAMLELPRAGITVDDISAVTAELLRAGAPIEALNTVRRAMSQLKGGGLARLLSPARTVTRILSDVPGLPPSFVASGPTMTPSGPPLSEIVERYGLTLPAGAQLTPHTDNDGDVAVVADHATARRALVAAGAARRVCLEDRPGVFTGVARELGRSLEPGAWVWGGETTVTVRGDGKGGRNHEVALAALLSGWTSGVLLAFGTDGVDGTSSAAGALVDAHAVAEASRRGLDAHQHLLDNDAGGFFEQLGTALHTGPTGTNVADLLMALPPLD